MLKDLEADQLKLYDLIWRRFVASQMANAVFDVTRVDIDAHPATAHLAWHTARWPSYPVPRERVGGQVQRFPKSV